MLRGPDALDVLCQTVRNRLYATAPARDLSSVPNVSRQVRSAGAHGRDAGCGAPLVSMPMRPGRMALAQADRGCFRNKCRHHQYGGGAHMDKARPRSGRKGAMERVPTAFSGRNPADQMRDDAPRISAVMLAVRSPAAPDQTARSVRCPQRRPARAP
jgi:hypothetical protein